MNTIEQILNIVNKNSNLDISTKSRNQEAAFARFIYFALCKKLTHVSLSKIGRLVNRDHSTVIYGLSQIEDILKQNTKYSILYNKCLIDLGFEAENFEIDFEINKLLKEDINKKDFTILRLIINDLLILNNEHLNEFYNYRVKPFVKLNYLSV